MSRVTRTGVFRELLVLAALLGVAISASVAFAWKLGAEVWPEPPGTPPAPIATDTVDVERALGDDPSQTLRIVVTGDVQNGLSEFADLLVAARAQRPDLVLLKGDLVNQAVPGRYAALRAVIREHLPGVPFLSVPGNHDLDQSGSLREYEAWVGPPEWRLEVAGWRILGIDDAAGPVSDASLQLVRDAASATPRPTLLLAHRPLAYPNQAEEGATERAAQLATVLRYPLRLTVAGHWHRSEDFTDARGTRHLVLGEDADRSSDQDEQPMAVTLVIGGDEPRVETWRVPRRQHFREEALRIGVGTLYPHFRARPVLASLGVSVPLAISAACVIVALRVRKRGGGSVGGVPRGSGRASSREVAAGEPAPASEAS